MGRRGKRPRVLSKDQKGGLKKRRVEDVNKEPAANGRPLPIKVPQKDCSVCNLPVGQKDKHTQCEVFLKSSAKSSRGSARKCWTQELKSKELKTSKMNLKLITHKCHSNRLERIIQFAMYPFAKNSTKGSWGSQKTTFSHGPSVIFARQILAR